MNDFIHGMAIENSRIIPFIDQIEKCFTFSISNGKNFYHLQIEKKFTISDGKCVSYDR